MRSCPYVCLCLQVKWQNMQRQTWTSFRTLRYMYFIWSLYLKKHSFSFKKVKQKSFVIRNTKQIFDGGNPVLMYETALTKMFFVTNSLCISTSIFYEHTKICINFYLTQFLMCKYLHLLSFTNTCELVWITTTLVHNIFIFFFVIYIYFQTAFNSICIQQIAYHFINM